MKLFGLVLVFLLSSLLTGAAQQTIPKPALAAPTPAPPVAWAANLPVYDHIVIVIEENKDYKQIINDPAAPYINSTLKAQGASFTRMYAEEHHSEGNYLWLFSGSNQNAGYTDRLPTKCFAASSLGEQLIRAGLSFKGYSEGLPAIGFDQGTKGNYATQARSLDQLLQNPQWQDCR